MKGTLRSRNGNRIDLPLVGSGDIRKNESGVFTLGGNNAYAGGTVITEGRLRIASGVALGAGRLMMTGGRLSAVGSDPLTIENRDLKFSRSISFGDSVPDNGMIHFSESNIATLTGHTTLHAASRVDIDAPIGQIGGSRSLTKTGPGLLVLVGNNSFSGGLLINQGMVHTYSSENALGLGTVTIADGATLQIADSKTYANAFELGTGTSTIRTDNSSRSVTLTGAISGSGGLDIEGGGRITLSHAGTYTIVTGTVNTDNLANLGEGGKVSLGDNKVAWFEEGSLHLVVAGAGEEPEPFEITDVTVSMDHGDAVVEVVFDSTGHIYTLQRTTNLVSGLWQDVASGESPLRYTNDTAQGFFRIKADSH